MLKSLRQYLGPLRNSLMTTIKMADCCTMLEKKLSFMVTKQIEIELVQARQMELNIDMILGL